MAIVYRTTSITEWGTGQGSDLSADQIDHNFWYLFSLYNSINDHLASVAVGIDTVEVHFNQMTFVMTDATTRGPFTLPMSQWNWRGTWQPSTVYNDNDVFTMNGSLYLVIYPHVSDLTFNPGAQTGGNDDYALILAPPGNALPTGGSIGQVLGKVGALDFQVAWVWPQLATLLDVALISPHEVGDILTWNGSHWYNAPASFLSAIPPPSESPLALGGVYPAAPVFSQWVYSIDTSGNVLLSQPDFGNLSGTVDPAQLPPSTLSTIGGIFAINAVTSQWVHSIDGTGTPHLSQPAFSDISGAISDIPGTLLPTQLIQLTKQTVTQSGASLTINHALGEICDLSLTADITSMTISNPYAAGYQTKIVLEVDNTGAFNITGWPSGTVAPGGTFPTITSGSGKKDRYLLSSWDHGTTWFLDVIGQDYHV